MDKREYSKAIRLIDQVNSICSISLPLEMAVIYSVSLLYTGRTDDALEIIDSLQIAENFSEEVASAAFTLASALIDCHLIEQGAVLSDLLLTLPSNSDAATFELAYRYSQARNDSDQCIEYLTKALEFLPEGSSEKRQELALALSQLYDEKGELLRSVEVTNKYITKTRHFVGKTGRFECRERQNRAGIEPNRARWPPFFSIRFTQCLPSIWIQTRSMRHVKSCVSSIRFFAPCA